MKSKQNKIYNNKRFNHVFVDCLFAHVTGKRLMCRACDFRCFADRQQHSVGTRERKQKSSLVTDIQERLFVTKFIMSSVQQERAERPRQQTPAHISCHS